MIYLSQLLKILSRMRFDDNIALVVFGSFAYTASPLSYDLKSISEMFNLMSDIGIAGSSTVLEGYYAGGRNSKAWRGKIKSFDTSNRWKTQCRETSPKEAVELAKVEGIKIYTIGIGSDYDKTLLETIAKKKWC